MSGTELAATPRSATSLTSLARPGGLLPLYRARSSGEPGRLDRGARQLEPADSQRLLPLQPGTTLGPYEVLSPIGAGGKGHDHRTGRYESPLSAKLTPNRVSLLLSFYCVCIWKSDPSAGLM